MSVWDELVGQRSVVELLQAVAASAAELVWARERDVDDLLPVAGARMTHAWLFTGPPGSGRSIAARAFAAALQCTTQGEPGCGCCAACHTVLAGSHADVEFVRPQGLSLGVREARELVLRAAMAPVGRHWQVMVVEDADRLTEGAANVLLKAIEEPAPRTVWLLCVPSADDLVVTIRSRCRVVALRTPPTSDVARVLEVRDGVEPAMAAFAARAAAGHVGRARRLALDPDARERRRSVLGLASSLIDVGGCLQAAAALVEAAEAEARELTETLEETETASLKEAFGDGATGGAAARGTVRAATAALKELEGRQKSRATRSQRDALDRALVDLAGLYRDVLVTQLDAPVELTNADEAAAIAQVAKTSTPEQTLRRLDAVLACRTLLEANANPLLAVEAMAVSLR